MPDGQTARENRYCVRFGTLAVEQGFLTPDQLKLALDEQVEDDLAGCRHRVIGAICFDRGWLTPAQIEQILNQLFKRKEPQPA